MRVKIDHRRQASPKQLVIEAAINAYLHQGRFSRDHMVGYLDDTVNTALVSDRFPFIRAVGEMSWVWRNRPVLTNSSPTKRYSTTSLRDTPQVLCMYDQRRFSGRMLFEAVKIYPKILINNCLIENFWYLPPHTT
jgi:hypothetical protein